MNRRGSICLLEQVDRVNAILFVHIAFAGREDLMICGFQAPPPLKAGLVDLVVHEDLLMYEAAHLDGWKTQAERRVCRRVFPSWKPMGS